MALVCTWFYFTSANLIFCTNRRRLILDLNLSENQNLWTRKFTAPRIPRWHKFVHGTSSLLWRWSKVNEDISPSDSMGGEIHDGFPPQLTSIKHLTGRRTVKNTFRISSSSKLRCQSSSSSTEMGLLASTDSEVKAFRLIPNAVGQRGKTSKPWSWTDLIILFRQIHFVIWTNRVF